MEFKNNVKKAWLKKFVQESPYNVGLDAAIIMNPQTWVTTGHVSSFSDPLLDCRACKARHRAQLSWWLSLAQATQPQKQPSAFAEGCF